MTNFKFIMPFLLTLSALLSLEVVTSVSALSVSTSPIAHNLNQNDFHQPMLICNAVQGWGSATVTKNNKVPMVGTESQENESDDKKSSDKNNDKSEDSKPLAFNECRTLNQSKSQKFFKDDRITFNFADVDVQGTFEIDDLPKSDSQLLLVVEKSQISSKTTDNIMSLSFQSFAFGSQQNLKGGQQQQSQVVFLNTIASSDSDSEETKPEDLLHMQEIREASDANAAATFVGREENVMFNRAYAIDEGNYNLQFQASDSTQKKQVFTLKSSKDYVVLKTGTASEPHLLIYPDDFTTASNEASNRSFPARIMSYLIPSFTFFQSEKGNNSTTKSDHKIKNIDNKNTNSLFLTLTTIIFPLISMILLLSYIFFTGTMGEYTSDYVGKKMKALRLIPQIQGTLYTTSTDSQREEEDIVVAEAEGSAEPDFDDEERVPLNV